MTHPCASGQLVINFPGSTLAYTISQVKITITELGKGSCTFDQDCPPSTYCDNSTKQCKECHGTAATCTSTTITQCGRFTHQWNTLGVLPASGCQAEYFNLNQFNTIKFDLKPIKTNGSTLSFWIFLPKVSNPLSSSPIVHFVLEDHFVVSMTYDSITNAYLFYMTAYQAYHKVSGGFIEETKTKEEFEAMLLHPYISKWHFKLSSGSKHFDKWIYGRFSVNYLISEIAGVLSHNTRVSTDNLFIQKQMAINTQYLYKDPNASTANSSSYHRKYYRAGDMIALHIKNAMSYAENDIPIIMHHLYILAVFIPQFDLSSPGVPMHVQGFEYYDLISIITNGGGLSFPELIFVCDFNIITRTSSGEFMLEYQDPIMTKVNVNIGIPEDEVKVYDYPFRLYRLNLLKTKNAEYNDNDFKTRSFPCPNGIMCFLEDQAFSCNPGFYVLPYGFYQCAPQCTLNNIIGRDLNRNNNGMCMRACTNCSTSKCTGTCPNGPTNISCNPNHKQIFDVCNIINSPPPAPQTYKQSERRGAMYYSYFYNHPPLLLGFPSKSSYYLEFLFLAETNQYLFPPKEFKGKKIYFLYTDAFALWHDYTLQSFYIDDKDGNTSLDYSHLINLNNWNHLLISSKSSNGLLYINNHFNQGITFISTVVSYIVFCHKDINCMDGSLKDIHWSSGYYKQMRLWDADAFNYITDVSMRSNYIYDDLALFNAVQANIELNLWQPFYLSLNILQGLISMNGKSLNNPGGTPASFDVFTSTPGNILYNTEGFPLYAFDDKQELYLRSGTESKFIKGTAPVYEEETCASCQSCYGPGNVFSQECNTCPVNSFFQNSDCIPIPSARKNYYAYATKFPNDSTVVPTVINFNPPSNRVTVTFWMKIIGLGNRSTQVIITMQNYRFRLSSNLLLTLDSQDITTSSWSSIASYDISKLLGQYIHISFAKYTYQSSIDNGLGWLYHYYSYALEINNKSIAITGPSRDLSYKVKKFTQVEFPLSNAYIIFANMNIYYQYLVGGYGFDQNIYHLSTTPSIAPDLRIINPTNEYCLNSNPAIKCINEYDPMFNDELFPTQTKQVLLEDSTISSCDDSCHSVCYGTQESECSCVSTSRDNWIYKNRCKRLDYIDFQRHQSVTFKNINCRGSNPGIEFWMFASYQGIIYYEYEIYWGSTRIMIIDSHVNNQLIFLPGIGLLSFLTPNNIWIKVRLWNEPSNTNYSISPSAFNTIGRQTICSNSPTELSFRHHYFGSSTDPRKDYSTGVLFFRQIRIWEDIIDPKLVSTEILKAAFSPIQAVIDPIMTNDYSVNIYPKPTAITASFVEKPALSFSYYSYNNDYEILRLCLETEDCSPIINLGEYPDLTIPSITHSQTGRYTIDLWIKTSNAAQLRKGINIIWEKHIAISLVTDITKDNLNYYCFPQEYHDSPKDKTGTEIFKAASKALNSYTTNQPTSSKNNQWINLRCSYDWDMEIYYLKDDMTLLPSEIPVNKEVTFQGHHMDYPVKHFLIDYEKTGLIIQHVNLNTMTETQIRNVHLYTEYFPPTFPISRVKYTQSNRLKSLVFAIDFMNCAKVPLFDQQECKALYDYEPLEQSIIFTYRTGSTSPTVQGGIILCEINKNEAYSSPDFKCKAETPPSPMANIKLFQGSTILECNDSYYLDINLSPYKCINTSCSNNQTRPPGSHSLSALCNFKCTTNHISCSSLTNLKDTLQCNPGYIRVGYKCLPQSKMDKTAFYFNRCFSFYPVHLQLDSPTQLSLHNGYAIEFWFKFDKVNEFCSKTNLDRYLLWAYPHSLYQKQNSDQVYYKDLKNSMSSPSPLTRISQFEWNYIIIKYQDNAVFIYVNHVIDQHDYTYTIATGVNYNLQAIAFCTHSQLCSPMGVQLNIKWGSAFYKKLRVYNLRLTNVHTINDYAMEKIDGGMVSGLTVYYMFNNEGNDLNVVKNEVASGNELDFNKNIPVLSLYRHEDKVLMHSSTSEFDWGEYNAGKYLAGIEERTGKVTLSGDCSVNCIRCYSDAYDQCYQCAPGYSLFNGECRKNTGTYFAIPTTLANEIKMNEVPSAMLSTTNPITVTLWMKFYGIKQSNTDPCVLMLRLSIIDDIFMCFDTTSSEMLLYAKGTIILFKDASFIKSSGKWLLVSFSNYKSTSTSPYYPELFSIAYDGNVVPRANSYRLTPPGLTLDSLSFGYNFLGLISEISIYSTFIMNPSGVISHNSAVKAQHRLLTVSLMGNAVTDCITSGTFTPDASSIVKCVGDYNRHQDQSLSCAKGNYLTPTGCQRCHSQCDYCEGSGEINCACYYDSLYIFRKHSANNQLWCQLLPYYDFAAYDKVEFTGLNNALTDEYTLELWFFVYSYDETNVRFTYQNIIWSHHDKITIDYDQRSKSLRVHCYPIDYDESVKVTDDTGAVNRWVHVVCATSLPRRRYYMNDFAYNTLLKDYALISGRSVENAAGLVLQSDKTAPLSDSIVLIREVRLWSLFNLREFPSQCSYSPSSSHLVPYLLHHFPMTTQVNGLITDSKGNEAFIVDKHSLFIGYNIVDYLNKYPVDQQLSECPLLYSLPSKGYWNMTTYLFIYSDTIPNVIKKDYYTSLSTYGEKSYADLILEPLKLNTLDNELLQKYSLSKYINTQVNIYLKAMDNKGVTHVGFTSITIEDYHKNKDIDYSLYAIGIDELPASMTHTQLWNRITVLASLSDVHAISSEQHNQTIASYAVSIGIVNDNPSCSEEYCSWQGSCSVIVRTLICDCYEGFTGTHCHILSKSKEFLEPIYLSYFDYITKNGAFATVAFDQTVLLQCLTLIKGASRFIDSNGSIYGKYYDMMRYLMVNAKNLLAGNDYDVLMTHNDLLRQIYVEANRWRLLGTLHNNLAYSSMEKAALDNTMVIKEMISLDIVKKRSDFLYEFDAYDIIVSEITRNDDYDAIFKNSRRMKYKSFINAKECARDIFGTGSHSILYLVMIDYKYNPRAYHEHYINTSTFMTDIYYANPLGLTIPKFICDSPIKIYFPINVFNLTKIDYINTYSHLLNIPDQFSPSEAFLYNPIYVDDKGVVLRKSRPERFTENKKAFSFRCTYYNPSTKAFEYNNKGDDSIQITSDFFIECPTAHLTEFVSLFNDEETIFPQAGLFFYMTYPQVFMCGENYGNGCFILMCVVLLLFIIGVVIIGVLDCFDMNTRTDMLENVKLSTLREQRLVCDMKEIKLEMIEINKIHRLNHGDKEKENEQTKEEAKEKEKAKEIDVDIDNMSNTNKRTLGQSITIHTYKDRIPDVHDTGSGKEIKDDVLRYKVKDYVPNANLGREENQYFEEMDDSGNEEYSFSDEDAESNPNTKLPMKDSEANLQSEHQTNPNPDTPKPLINPYFQETIPAIFNIRTTNIPRTTKLISTNKVESYRNIPSFYEDIENRQLSSLLLFFILSYRRNLYLTPFTTISLFNPRWKRIVLLYTFTSFLSLYITILLSLMERTGIPEGGKMMLFALCALILTHSTYYLLVLLYRVSSFYKERMFDLLKSSAQLKLMHEWKTITSLAKTKMIIGMVISGVAMLLSFYMTFNYCSVLYYSVSSFNGTFGIAIAMDAIVFQPLMIFILVIMYKKRKDSKEADGRYRGFFRWITFNCCL